MGIVRNKFCKGLCTFLTAAVVFSAFSFPGMGWKSKAATESSLKDTAKSGTFKIGASLTTASGEEDLLDGNVHDINYGDSIDVEISWEFDNNTPIISGDSFVFLLPTQSNETPPVDILFFNVDKDITDEQNNPVGKLDISNNKITVTYTDEQFCKRNEKKGYLSFSGKVGKSDGSETAERDVTFNLDDAVELKLHILPVIPDNSFSVNKEFSDEISADSNGHVYECTIKVTSIADNSDVRVVDDMYPGMSLNSGTLKFYTDAACTTELDTTRLTINNAAGRNIDATINSMSNGESVYMKYQVTVLNDMYDWNSANAYLQTLGADNIYTNGEYFGRVPNSVRVWSNEIAAENAIWSWDDIYTLNAGLNKWSNAPENKTQEGLLSWQITLYNIVGTDYMQGDVYIIDELPSNTILYNDEVNVMWGGTEHPDAITVSYPDINDKSKVQFTLSQELIDHLKSSTNAEALLSYYTKVEQQDIEKEYYKNTATLYYKGTAFRTSVADMFYTKPDAVDKIGIYEHGTAPNIEYEIYVNPASLDLVQGTDDLTLTDVMSAAYDLIPSTVKVNGQTPSASEFDFNPTTRKLIFKLQDKTAYTITYEARVNLAPGNHLTKENSTNSVNLTANGQTVFTDDCYIDRVVYANSASASSSDNRGSLNIVKHDSSSVTLLLSGAEFTLTEMTLSSGGSVTGSSGTSKTTGQDGAVSFSDLTRDSVYMLTETKSPDGYDPDTTPRFYVFAGAGKTYPSTVSYNGSSYPLTVIDIDHTSLYEYIGNDQAATPVIQNAPATPETSAPSSTMDPVTASAPVAAIDPTVSSEPSAASDPAGTSSSASVPKTGEERSPFILPGIITLAVGAVFGPAVLILNKNKKRWEK